MFSVGECHHSTTNAACGVSAEKPQTPDAQMLSTLGAAANKSSAVQLI